MASSLIPIESKNFSGPDFDDDDDFLSLLGNDPSEKKHDPKKEKEYSLRQQPTIAETQYGYNDFDSFDDDFGRVNLSNPINQHINKIESTVKNEVDYGEEFSNIMGELDQPKSSIYKGSSESTNDTFSTQVKSPAFPVKQHLVSPNLISMNQQDNTSPLQLYATNINHGEIFSQLPKNEDFDDIQSFHPNVQRQNTTPPNYKPPNISPSPPVKQPNISPSPATKLPDNIPSPLTKPTNNNNDQLKKQEIREASPRKDTYDSDDFNLDIDFIDDGKDKKTTEMAQNSTNDDSNDWQIDGKPSYKMDPRIVRDNTSLRKDTIDFDDEFSEPHHLIGRAVNQKTNTFGQNNIQTEEANQNNNNRATSMFGGPFNRSKAPSRISPDYVISGKKFVLELPPSTQYDENQTNKITTNPPPPPPHIDIQSPAPHLTRRSNSNENDQPQVNSNGYNYHQPPDDVNDEFNLYYPADHVPMHESTKANAQTQPKSELISTTNQAQSNLNDKKTRDSASLLRNELNNFKKKLIDIEEQKKILELKLQDTENKYSEEIGNLQHLIGQMTTEKQDLSMELKSIKQLNATSSTTIKEKEEFYFDQLKEKDNMICELKKIHQSKSEEYESRYKKEIDQLSTQYREQIDNMRNNHDKEIERLKTQHTFDLNQRESILNDKNNIDQLSMTMKLNSETLTNLLTKFNIIQDELTKNKLVEFKSKEIVFGQIEQSINIQKQQIIVEAEKLNELLHHIEGRDMLHEAKYKDNETRMRQESIRFNNMIENIKDENKILLNSMNEEKLKIKEEKARLLKEKTDQELLLNDKFEQIRLKERSLESEIQNVKQEKEQYIQLKNRLKMYQDNLDKELFNKHKDFNEKENLLSNREKDLIYKISDFEKNKLEIDLRSKDLERQEEKLRIYSETITKKSNELSSLINKLQSDKDQFERQKNLTETQLISQTKEMEYRKGQLDEQIKQINKQRTEELRSKYLPTGNINSNTITDGFNRTSPYTFDNINRYDTMTNPINHNYKKTALFNNYSNTNKVAPSNYNTRQSRPKTIDDVVYSALASAKSLTAQIY